MSTTTTARQGRPRHEQTVRPRAGWVEESWDRVLTPGDGDVYGCSQQQHSTTGQHHRPPASTTGTGQHHRPAPPATGHRPPASTTGQGTPAREPHPTPTGQARDASNPNRPRTADRPRTASRVGSNRRPAPGPGGPGAPGPGATGPGPGATEGAA